MSEHFPFVRVNLVQMRCPSSLASLKTASCLSKTAQTWREKPANYSDLVNFSGKSFRYGEKIRLLESVHDTTPRSKATSRKTRLKNAKNLYLSHRFFNKIRQIHRFFDVFRLELSKQVQRLVMVDFPRALPTQTLTWS